MTRYFLFAGEASGDLHGSHLIEALQFQEISSSFCGVGGPRMRQKGLECFVPMENFQVMGFSDVLQAFPRLCKLFFQLGKIIVNIQPDCVIFIDYPGFNLRLARSLRRQGFKGKLVQYICPTVWAHGKSRIDLLATYYDLLLTIFPFEAEYFAHTSLKVEYIGNPLVETIRTHRYQDNWAAQAGLPSTEHLIAFFPGSRKGEVERYLPQQIQVAAQLKYRYPQARFALSCAQESLLPLINISLRQHHLHLNEDFYVIPPQFNYELMRSCHLALAKSGTVTLELALHDIPTVVHYELSTFNYLMAKYYLRLNLPHYCIVNILEGEKVFPEFIHRNLSAEAISAQAALLYSNNQQRQQIIEACQRIKHKLGTHSSHQNAAKAIHELSYDRAL